MHNKRKGFILLLSYGIVAVLLILVAAFTARSISEWRTAERGRNSVAALYAAEAGIDYGLEWLRAQNIPPGGTASFTLPAGPALSSGTYTVWVDPDDNNPNVYLKKYAILSNGRNGDCERNVSYLVQVDSFARYIWLTDMEVFRLRGSDIPVYFTSGDLLTGPCHTNGNYNISGNPTFNDVVSSAEDFINYLHGGPPADNPTFAQGIQLGTDEIPLPSKALDLRTAAVHDGYHFEGPTTIVLNASGTMTVTNNKLSPKTQTMALPANGAVFVTGARAGENLNVSGTLQGQLSIGTNRDLIITGNITYANDPTINPDSTDILGLIAEKDVIISSSASPLGGNLTIQASIMAMDDSFYLDNWSSGLKGTLNIYGGIIQDRRGPVGTFSSRTGSKVSGYTKNYVYDSRLRTLPPPFYPTTGDYVGLSWREQ